MEHLSLLPAALDLLKVAKIATAPADPDFHIFQEWCDWQVEKHSAVLLNQNDLTGILYWNKDLDFQVISMIVELVERSQRHNLCIGQYGTRLSRGSEPIWFNRAELYGEIVAPIRKPNAGALKLVYDASKVVMATSMGPPRHLTFSIGRNTSTTSPSLHNMDIELQNLNIQDPIGEPQEWNSRDHAFAAHILCLEKKEEEVNAQSSNTYCEEQKASRAAGEILEGRAMKYVPYKSTSKIAPSLKRYALLQKNRLMY